jgi:hypothetical protein
MPSSACTGNTPPIFDHRGRDQATHRQSDKGDQQYQPIAFLFRHPHRGNRSDDHHALRDHDGHGDKACAVALLSGDHRQAVERQHRGVAEMKQRQCGGQYQ